MDIFEDYEERKQKLLKWQSSPEYQQLCQTYQAEFDRLSMIAANLQQKISELKEYRQTHTVRHEFASRSDLHRGFYSPSPVFDLIVGNTHRGRILKRVTARSNPTHVYGFDSQNRLLWCDSLSDGSVTETEYLVYQNNTVYGITFDWTGTVYIITEEIYKNSKLIQYTHCLCPSLDESKQCVELNCEKYTYNDEGLHYCELHTYCNPSDNLFVPCSGDTSPYLMPQFKNDSFLFNHEDGFIVSYTSNDITYYPSIRRKT